MIKESVNYYRIGLFVMFIVFLCAKGLADEFVPVKYWVSFTDKKNSPYSIDRPLEFLSQRSVERRVKQGIGLNEQDLPVNPHYISILLEDQQVEVLYTSRWFNGALMRIPDSVSLARISELTFIDNLQYVKPLLEEKKVENPSLPAIHSTGSPLTQDELYVAWPRIDYGIGRRQIQLVNGQALHQEGFLGQGKIIAVLDAGFTNADILPGLVHLWENNQILGTKDFVDPGSDFFATHSHGTYVLSTMASYRPSELVGTAVEAKYWLMRTEDASSEFPIEEYNWLAAVELADSAGVDVINTSLGYTRFDDAALNYTYSDMDGLTTVSARAANMAFERGIFLVTSAGNSGEMPWRYIGTPADSFGVLAVGATDSLGFRVGFSSVGPSADGRFKPEVMAMGSRVVVENLDGNLRRANGTSFSSPIIAGLAACLWQKYPMASAASIKRAIIESSSLFNNPSSPMGYGIPDFGLADKLLKSNFILNPEPIVLYPNPVSVSSTLTFFSDFQQNAFFEIFDITGRLIYISEKMPVNAGFNSILPFRSFQLPAQGMYLLRMVYSQQPSTPVIKLFNPAF
jgi:serine protease AprX